MKIELNQKEYELLMDIMYTANYVFNAFLSQNADEREKYNTLEQKIMSYAKQFGKENLVQWDEKKQEFLPSESFLEKSRSIEYIEDFEVNSFWEQLIDRLAIRDIFNEYGENVVKQMDEQEFLLKRDQFREKYEDEFEKNGLKNIFISESSYD